MYPQQPREGPFDSFTRAVMAGMEFRRQREAEQQAKEERKLRIQALQQEAQRLRLQDKMEAFKLMQGQRGPMVERPGEQQPVLFSPGGQMQLPGPSTMEEQQLPEFDFSELQPGLRLRPQNMGEVLAQQRAQKLMELALTTEGARQKAQAEADVASRPLSVNVPDMGQVDAPANVLPGLLQIIAQQREKQTGREFDATQKGLDREAADRHQAAQIRAMLQAAGIQAGGQTVNVDTVDAQGNPVTKVVPRREAIGQTFPKAPTGEAANSRRNAQIALKGVDEIASAFNPGWVGPFQGRKYAAQETVGVGTDPQRSEFAAAVAVLNNQVINALSGAAVSASEYARLKRQIPLVTDPPQVFQSKLAATRKNLERISNPTAPGPSGRWTAGPIATNDKGERVQWNGSAWVPIQ